MNYTERFTSAELIQVINESLVYMCACPAQVAESILKLRDLHRYELACLADTRNQVLVHESIARSTAVAHAELEACMAQVLALEGWDLATLKMPAGLRERQMQDLLSDE